MVVFFRESSIIYYALTNDIMSNNILYVYYKARKETG